VTTPLVAIVGRPNVGKSTLFNRLVGGRPALVHDTPHLTRDRRYGELDYFGTALRVVDTGGLDPEVADKKRDAIGAGIHRQAMRAIDEADALVLVVDGRAGVSAIDHALARALRATGKPVWLAVNKIDGPSNDALVHDFHELGLGKAWAVSAAHGRGVDALVEAIVEGLGPRPSGPSQDDEEEEAAEEPAGPLRVAFVGRPNAGKSSLTNRLLGEERSLVHHEAGTTTDPVDAAFSLGGKDYILVDTAGIRRKAKIDEEVEKIAVSVALGQVERADVVVLVVDAEIGPSEQDARLAGTIEEAGKALVIALNKSDTITGEAAKAALRDKTAETFHFMPWAPVTMISALRGDGVDRVLELVDRADVERRRRIQTSQLNRFFAEVLDEKPPPLHHGRAVRIHYLTQGAIRPPTFILWASAPEGLAPSYRRFVANRLRERYGFRGTPIRIVVKAKKDRHKDQK
jgi:GTP-binding protein